MKWCDLNIQTCTKAFYCQLHQHFKNTPGEKKKKKKERCLVKKKKNKKEINH